MRSFVPNLPEINEFRRSFKQAMDLLELNQIRICSILGKRQPDFAKLLSERKRYHKDFEEQYEFLRQAIKVMIDAKIQERETEEPRVPCGLIIDDRKVHLAYAEEETTIREQLPIKRR